MLKESLIKEIEESFLKGKSLNFLHFIKLGVEKKLLTQDYVEYYFLKSIEYCKKEGIQSLYQQINCFGINNKKAGLILENYIELELKEESFETSYYFLLVEKVITPAIQANIVLKEELLLNESIKSNLSEHDLELLMKINRENKCNELNKELNKKLKNKKVSTNLRKI